MKFSLSKMVMHPSSAISTTEMIAENRSPNNWDCVAPGGRFGIGRCPSWVLDIVLRSSSVMVIRAVNFLISLHRVVMRK